MVFADPSECIESSKILPSIHQNYKIVIERPFGWSILSNVLKDIADHFFQLILKSKKFSKRYFRYRTIIKKKISQILFLGCIKTNGNKKTL